MSTLTALPVAVAATPAAASSTAIGPARTTTTPLDTAVRPARNPTHSGESSARPREEPLMKPLDAAVLPAPERSVRPPEPAQARETERRGHGEVITAGSLRGLDPRGDGPGDAGAMSGGAGFAVPAPDSPKRSSAAGMPNFLARQEVNAMIRKLRQSVSLWERIQNVGVDEQRLEQVRDELLSHRQLIR